MPKLGDVLKRNATKPAARKTPVWQGPCGKGSQGGVTQGLIGRYLCCPERFRVMVVEGWRGVEKWQSSTGYGDMWHCCEEALAALPDPSNKVDQWEPLKKHVQQECRHYTLQQQEILDWYDKCRVAFPLYVKHWQEHPDVQDRVPIFQEQVFDVPYNLPSGRTVRLRGKFDAVDLIGKGSDVGVWLQENKTKSRIEEGKIQHQLMCDLQTMVYLIALRGCIGQLHKKWQRYVGQIKGVRYNVVKRPAQYCGKKETRDGFMDRLRGIIEENPSEFFHRWKVTITDADVDKFRRECLDPILENLCDAYEWWRHCYTVGKDWSVWDYLAREKAFPLHRQRHFILPFGLHNTVLEANYSDLDEYLYSGSTVGLERVETLFRELETENA